MRATTGRPTVIVFGPVYHGESSTLAASLSSDRAGVANHAAAFTAGIVHVPYPGTAPGVDALPFLTDWVLRYQVDPATVAGVLIEPVSTEGGVLCPPAQFWDDLTQVCTEHRWLLAVDEVQTGMGRLGGVFAIDRWGVQPDLLLLGKGLSAGGMPIAAILGSERVMARSDLSQGSTFGWQPAACAAALAGLDVLTDPGTLAHVADMERLAEDILEPLRHVPWVRRVTVMGAEVAVEYDLGDWDTTCQFTGTLTTRLLERGVVGIGEDDKVFYRLQPPLLLPLPLWQYALTQVRDTLTDGP